MPTFGFATMSDLDELKRHYDARLKEIVDILREIKPESFKDDVNPEAARPAREKPYTWEDAMRHRLLHGT